jgi:hypothetical protein
MEPMLNIDRLFLPFLGEEENSLERRKHSRNVDMEDLVHHVYIGIEHSCSVCRSMCVLPKLTAYAERKGGACTCTSIVDESASFPVLSLARLQPFRSLPYPTKQSPN